MYLKSMYTDFLHVYIFLILNYSYTCILQNPQSKLRMVITKKVDTSRVHIKFRLIFIYEKWWRFSYWWDVILIKMPTKDTSTQGFSPFFISHKGPNSKYFQPEEPCDLCQTALFYCCIMKAAINYYQMGVNMFKYIFIYEQWSLNFISNFASFLTWIFLYHLKNSFEKKILSSHALLNRWQA